MAKRNINLVSAAAASGADDEWVDAAETDELVVRADAAETDELAYDIYKLYMDLPIFIHKHKRQKKRPRH